ncbi:hypothetical protein BU15DRAFT_46651 [Melanogaster broomeanus]|nr:hypothetical protein BU15DRAFT_46651 [Melanogaster broomeanus]
MTTNLPTQERATPRHLKLEGLQLANYLFEPLLSPVPATEAQWSDYADHRRRTNSAFGNVLDRPKRSISQAIAAVEQDMGLPIGTLQKCVSVLERDVLMDDETPRDADMIVRIYSPAAPKYIDVHVKYYCRSRYYEIEWYYSLGYKIHHRIPATTSNTLSVVKDYILRDEPPNWHTRHGWQQICWGYFDDSEGNHGPKWRRRERGALELYDEGVLDIHDSLFGPMDEPPSDDEAETLVYRRKLVSTVRLLFATVGIDYRVACTDEEEDERPDDYMLEGLSDKWVARGIREACGFQLKRDPAEEKRGKEERKQEALDGNRDDDDDEDDEDSDEDEGENEEEEEVNYSDEAY